MFVYTTIVAGITALVWPLKTGLQCYGDGLSQGQRDRIFTAYFDALHEGKVERPISYVEYKGFSAYTSSDYRPMIKIYPYTNLVTVQISQNTLIQYAMDQKRISQGDGIYAFKELKRLSNDEK